MTVCPFVETTVYHVIRRGLDRSIRHSWNGLITGAAGVGKTRAILELVEKNRGARWDREPGPFGYMNVVEVSAALGSSLFELLHSVAGVLGLGTAEKGLTRLERELRSRDRTEDVIIFDEAQFLSLKAARTLLGISEATGLRVLFIGNPEVLKLVNSGQAAVQQVSRRLPIRETIDFIDDADADLLANAFGCEGMDTYRAVREIAQKFHADGIVKVLSEARTLAQATGHSTIKLQHVARTLDIFPQFNGALRKCTG